MDARTLLGGYRCGDVAVGVTSLAVAGAASPADLAEVVVVDVAPLAVAGVVTVGVATLAAARAASLADAGMAFPADPAGVVTVGVASLADAGKRNEMMVFSASFVHIV